MPSTVVSRVRATKPGLVNSLLQLLDEFNAADFSAAERILDVLRRQGRTLSGYPRIRPGDCERVIKALAGAFEANRPLFRLGDSEAVEKFEAIIEAFTQSDVQFYPQQLVRARLLQAEAKMMLGDWEGVQRLIGHYADRPYAIEGGFQDVADVMKVDCRARALAGGGAELGALALSRAVMLARLRPGKAWKLAAEFGGQIGLGSREWGQGLLSAGVVWCCKRASRAKRNSVNRTLWLWAMLDRALALTMAGALLYLLRFGDVAFGKRPGRDRSPDIVVTRAMGGIGDLLMMTPGLRALARKWKRPIKLAVPRKFFSVFANNPHVELVDIDGPPIDVGACRAWFNLTICPAGAYELRRRPFVKKSRVELFARGVGVRRALLARHGWDVEVHLDEAQRQFCREFLLAHRFGDGPIVGVQPYSRDFYKDHNAIVHYIAALSKDYDVLVFHHADDGLPTGERIATTAGLSLAQSLALVSAVDAMVCINSAFLHAAAAFDVPVVAIFGPTDGKLFTRHHRQATVLSLGETFPCLPCWRNEDLPCQLTNQPGPSPCVSAVSLASVREALAAALSGRRFAKKRLTAEASVP